MAGDDIGLQAFCFSIVFWILSGIISLIIITCSVRAISFPICKRTFSSSQSKFHVHNLVCDKLIACHTISRPEPLNQCRFNVADLHYLFNASCFLRYNNPVNNGK